MIEWLKNILEEIYTLVGGGILLFLSYFLPAYAVKNEVWWPFLIIALFWGIFIWSLSDKVISRKRDPENNLHNIIEDIGKHLEKKTSY